MQASKCFSHRSWGYAPAVDVEQYPEPSGPVYRLDMGQQRSNYKLVGRTYRQCRLALCWKDGLVSGRVDFPEQRLMVERAGEVGVWAGWISCLSVDTEPESGGASRGVPI